MPHLLHRRRDGGGQALATIVGIAGQSVPAACHELGVSVLEAIRRGDRAIGVARAIAYATLAGEPVFARPSARFLQSGEKEPGEPHSAYHEYLFKLRKIKDRLFTSTARALAVERDAYIAAYFEQLQAEMNGEK